MNIKDIKIGMMVKIPTTKGSISYSLEQFLRESGGRQWATVNNMTGRIIGIGWSGSAYWDFLPEDLEPYENISSFYEIY